MSKAFTLVLALISSVFVLAVAAWGVAFITVWSYIRLWTEMALAQVVGFPEGTVKLLAFLIAFVCAGLVLRWAFVVLFGRHRILYSMMSLAAALSFASAWHLLTANWHFDEKGEPVAWVCPPLEPGGLPRLQRFANDRVLGIQCPAVTGKAIVALRAMRRGQVPTQVIVSSVREFDQLKWYRNGSPVLFISSNKHHKFPPIYDAPGHDDTFGDFLEVPSDEQKVEMREAIVRWEEERTERVAVIQAQKTEELLTREKEKRDQLQRERTAAAKSPPKPRWTAYFKYYQYEPAPVVVVVGVPSFASFDRDVAISSVVGGVGYHRAEEITKARFWESLNFDSILAGDTSTLASVEFPSELRELVIIRAEAITYSGSIVSKATVRAVIYDPLKRTFEPRSIGQYQNPLSNS